MPRRPLKPCRHPSPPSPRSCTPNPLPASLRSVPPAPPPCGMYGTPQSAHVPYRTHDSELKCPHQRKKGGFSMMPEGWEEALEMAERYRLPLCEQRVTQTGGSGGKCCRPEIVTTSSRRRNIYQRWPPARNTASATAPWGGTGKRRQGRWTRCMNSEMMWK